MRAPRLVLAATALAVVAVAACGTLLDDEPPARAGTDGGQQDGASASGPDASDGSVSSGQDASPKRPDYDKTVLADEPLCLWRLGEATGDVAQNATGAWPGTYAGDLERAVPGALKSDEDGATRFLGGNSGRVVVVAGMADGSFAFPFEQYTLELWLKPSSGNTSGVEYVVASVDQGGGTPTGITMTLATESGSVPTLTFTHYRASSPIVAARHALAPPPQYWHVVVTEAAGTLRLYVNGVLAETSSDAGAPIPGEAVSPDFVIGADSMLANGFAGAIDEVAIYQRALDASEVASHYAAAGY